MPGLSLSFAFEKENTERRQGHCERMGSSMRRDRCGFKTSKISLATPTVQGGIAVEGFFPETASWDPYSVVISRNGGQIANDEEKIPRASSLPQKANNAFFPIMKIHPLKTFLSKIQLMDGRFGSVEVIEVSDPPLDSLMRRIRKPMPFEALLMDPFSPLTELRTHEHQFFTGVTIHVSEKHSEIGHSLPFVSGHLPDQSTLPIGHFIVRKGKDEIFIKGVPDTEGQLMVVVLSE